MSCISVTLGTKPIGGATAIVHHTHKVYVTTRTNAGSIMANTIHVNPKVNASKVGETKLNIFLVCKTGNDAFLFVRPDAALWITVDKSIRYDVRSNTDWIIH